MIAILAVAVLLVAWSLHLMQEAMNHREFSLMLAGTLVAFSAAAMMTVYFLMGHYVGYITEMAQRSANEFPSQWQVQFSQLTDSERAWLTGEDSTIASPALFPAVSLPR